MNIAIVGDSWAWGEWNFIGDTNFPTHSGVQQYLHEHFPDANIVNFAVAGGGNIYQLDHISESIGHHQFSKYFDVVLCFWTDPGRDVLNHLETVPEEDRVPLTKPYYEKLCIKTSKKFLEGLNNFNLPVFIMGGQVSVPEFVKEYDNIKVIEKRISNIVEKPFFCDQTIKPLKGTLDNTIDWKAIERLESDIKPEWLQEVKKDQDPILNPFYFPDGGHAGRELHKKVANKIIKHLEKLNGS